jgi:hypothetical protein
MTIAGTELPRSPKWAKVVAALAAIFGVMTLFSGGSVLFGPDLAQEAAGNYMAFVVWFNFLAGFAYVIAAIGIWLNRGWAIGLSALIAAATCLAALGFGIQVVLGASYEMRTVAALILRIGIWVAITLALLRARRA